MASTLDTVIGKHRAEVERLLLRAEEQIADGQRLVSAGRAAKEAAVIRSAVLDDLYEELRADSRRSAPDLAIGGLYAEVKYNGNGHAAPTMATVIDGIMEDGAVHTIDELHAELRRQGIPAARQSVGNRCSERVREGVYATGPRRGSYQLASTQGGTQLPTETVPAVQGGEREMRLDGDSQDGPGVVTVSSSASGTD